MSEPPGREGGAPGAEGPEALAERRLRGLVELSHVLGSARRFDDVIRLSADAARAALEAASVSISRWERESGQLRTLVNAGQLAPWEEPRPTEEVHLLADRPAVLEQLETGRGRVFTADARDGLAVEADRLRRAGRWSALIVPVVLEGRTWGEFYATRGPDRPAFSDADLGFATAAAAHIAAGIAQAGHLEEANRLAYTDPLTGLANRRAVDERLDEVMERHRRDANPVSFVLCDINQLKTINDLHGHESGDRLLLDVARLLGTAGAALPGSLAGRLGGDEFCLLAEGRTSDEVVAVARRLAEDAERLPGGFGMSVGVASTDDPVGIVDTPKRLLRLADAAQYRAKRSGSTEPVVAGRRLPAEAALALPAVPEIEPGVPERRRAFPRSSVDPAAILAGGLRALDAAAGGDPSARADVHRRLEVVAEAVASRLDAAGWWLSYVPPGGRRLRSMGWSMARPGHAGLTEPGGLLDREYDLGDYPWTEAALRGGGYALEAGAPGNDPAEDALLVAAGWRAAVAAGVTTDAGGWLVEVFADEISARVEGLAPVLRALVCVAANA